MTGKDVCQWLLNKYDDEALLEIYKQKGIVCKGFRAGTVNDIKAHRRRLITNLLQPSNKKKLYVWYTKNDNVKELEHENVEEKEINELISLAYERGVATLFIQLLHKNQIEKAVRLFAEAADKNQDLLDIPNQSINLNGEMIEQKEVGENHDNKDTPLILKNNKSDITFNQHIKKERKLEQKIENLKQQLELQNKQCKKKIKTLEANQDRLLQQKQEQLDNAYKRATSLKNQVSDYEIRIKDYERKFSQQSRIIENLNTRILELDKELTETKEKIDKGKLNVLVIGEPGSKEMFVEEGIKFSFLTNEEVIEYEFREGADLYLVLAYELSKRDQFLLRQNIHFEQLPKEKISICSNFTDAREIMNNYSSNKVRI